MKILFIADLHGKSENLEKLQKLNFDKLTILGDVFSSNAEANNKLLNILNSYKDKIIYIMGNCDSKALFDSLNLRYVEDYLKYRVDNLNLYLSHGNKYNYHHQSVFDAPGIIIYGHEHYPYIEKEGENVYICVGSLENPRYGSSASYLIYENNTFSVIAITGEIISKIKVTST